MKRWLKYGLIGGGAGVLSALFGFFSFIFAWANGNIIFSSIYYLFSVLGLPWTFFLPHYFDFDFGFIALIMNGLTIGLIINGLIVGLIIGMYKERKRINPKKFWKIVSFLILIVVIILMGFILMKTCARNIGCSNEKARLELRAYDSQGNITGVIDGITYMNISGAYSFGEYNVRGEFFEFFREVELPARVLIFGPIDYNFTYEVFAIKGGGYTFTLSDGPMLSADAGSKVSRGNIFNAVNIPISTGETHRYTLDFKSLERGEEGVTIFIDEDGEGLFDNYIKTGYEISCEEFLIKKGWISKSGILIRKVIFILAWIIIAFVLILLYWKFVVKRLRKEEPEKVNKKK